MSRRHLVSVVSATVPDTVRLAMSRRAGRSPVGIAVGVVIVAAGLVVSARLPVRTAAAPAPFAWRTYTSANAPFDAGEYLDVVAVDAVGAVWFLGLGKDDPALDTVYRLEPEPDTWSFFGDIEAAIESDPARAVLGGSLHGLWTVDAGGDVWVLDRAFDGTTWRTGVDLAGRHAIRGPVIDRLGILWFVARDDHDIADWDDDTYHLVGVDRAGDRTLEADLYGWLAGVGGRPGLSDGYEHVDLLLDGHGRANLVMPDYLLAATFAADEPAWAPGQFEHAYEIGVTETGETADGAGLSPAGEIAVCGHVGALFAPGPIILLEQVEAPPHPGYKWRIIDVGDAPASPGTKLLWPAQGETWVLGTTGVHLYDAGAWHHIVPANSGLPHLAVNDLAGGADGTVWFATDDGAASARRVAAPRIPVYLPFGLRGAR